jgi:hypothetical protein
MTGSGNAAIATLLTAAAPTAAVIAPPVPRKLRRETIVNVLGRWAVESNPFTLSSSKGIDRSG